MSSSPCIWSWSSFGRQVEKRHTSLIRWLRTNVDLLFARLVRTTSLWFWSHCRIGRGRDSHSGLIEVLRGAANNFDERYVPTSRQYGRKEHPPDPMPPLQRFSLWQNFGWLWRRWLSRRWLSRRWNRVSEHPIGLRSSNVLHQSLHSRLKVRAEGIDPVRAGEVVLKLFGQPHIFGSKRENPNAKTERTLDLGNDMRRRIRLGRENQHHRAGALHSTHNFGRVGLSRSYVTRRNPASGAALLKAGTDPPGNFTLGSGVADKHVTMHSVPRSQYRAERSTASAMCRRLRLRGAAAPVNLSGTSRPVRSLTWAPAAREPPRNSLNSPFSGVPGPEIPRAPYKGPGRRGRDAPRGCLTVDASLERNA